MLLVEGDRIVIGRTNTSGCVGLETRLPTGAADAVSRSHAAFSLVEFMPPADEVVLPSEPTYVITPPWALTLEGGVVTVAHHPED